MSFAAAGAAGELLNGLKNLKHLFENSTDVQRMYKIVMYEENVYYDTCNLGDYKYTAQDR